MRLRSLALVLVVLFTVVVPAAAQAPAAAPSAEMVRTGSTEYEHFEAGASAQGVWFRSEEWYTVALYLPKDRIATVLEPFRADTLEEAVRNEGLWKAVIDGGVDRVVELTMTRGVTAKQLRADFNERLGKQIRVSSREMGAFNKCLQADLAEGDKVRMAISAAGSISITAGGRTCPDIVSQKLVTAMLGLWMGYDGSPRSASDMAELFADVRPMLDRSAAAAEPAPAEPVAPAAPAAPPAAPAPAAVPAAAPSNPPGSIVCRKGSDTLKMEVPAGSLEEIYGIAARLGYTKRDCRFTPDR